MSERVEVSLEEQELVKQIEKSVADFDKKVDQDRNSTAAFEAMTSAERTTFTEEALAIK